MNIFFVRMFSLRAETQIDMKGMYKLNETNRRPNTKTYLDSHERTWAKYNFVCLNVFTKNGNKNGLANSRNATNK